MQHRRFLAPLVALAVVSLTFTLDAGNTPIRARNGMVVSQSDIASDVGWKVMREGGNAIDGAVATAFALAVTRDLYAHLRTMQAKEGESASESHQGIQSKEKESKINS